jgi:pilus assembly protein CpaB
MRLDRRFLIVMALSLFWAFLVSAVFFRVARGPQDGGDYSKRHKPLVVAARPLPLGDTISRETVRTRNVPEDLFPSGGFSRVEDVIGRPVISPILADEPIVESRLASRGAGPGLGPMIPDGMRAIAVRVNDVVGVAGFILPGMRVDVLSTGRAPGRDEIVTRTVLENIAVLSVGQTVQVDAKSQAINAAVVTLLVSPEQAEGLTLANNEGRIQLVLRNSTDQNAHRPPGRELRELFTVAARGPLPPVEPDGPPPRQSAAPRRQAQPSPAQPRPSNSSAIAAVAVAGPDQVVIFRGTKKSVELFPEVKTSQ